MLSIKVVAYNGGAPSVPLEADFPQGGSIGRGVGNTLTLPDPDRRISRTHARIAAQGDAYVLEDVGSGLPVELNGRPLGKGGTSPLAHGDVLLLGGYMLRVEVQAAPLQAPGAPAAAIPAASSNAVDDPLALFGGSSASPADPFADLLAPKAPANAPAAAVPAAPPSSSGGNFIPDDFDPFADLSNPKPGTAPAPRPLDLGAGPGIPNQNIDQLFGLGNVGKSSGDPFGLGNPLSEPIRGPNTGPAVDPLEALNAPLPSAGYGAPVQRDDAPEVNAAFTPPQMKADPALLPPEPALAPPQPEEHQTLAAKPALTPFVPPVPAMQPPPDTVPAPAPAGASVEAAALFAAFLQGAGVPDLELPPMSAKERMRVLGEIFRATTEGTLQLLHARAMTKREVQAEGTMIAARENNPLKFSPTVEVALEHLLLPTGRGFMPPVKAMRDAYEDLRSHQFGVVAGMQAALEGVLQRFDPAKLEGRLTQKKGVLDSLMQSNRKAKLWDLFNELYTEISKEAEDDFNTLFGRAFLKAYQAQIAKLRAQGEK